MRYYFVLPALLFLFACGNADKPAETADTGKHTTKDSMKDALADMPPPSEAKQFEWFYSLFVKGMMTDSIFQKFIHPENGVYMIESNGAMPQMKNVTDISDFTTAQGKPFFTISRDDLICELKDEELPKVDCDSKDFYSKSGCFTREENTFKEEKTWQYCHLTPDEEKKVTKMAAGITRVVINTKNYRYYFSLINGSWYISFIDMRKPCQA
ncbi:MAG: hypothetical protein FD123_1440 [Bacteroidetes bacterium]|nr:MAG: hypothetical protein FD123_1440 [Bacteroidota bacterium]